MKCREKELAIISPSSLPPLSSTHSDPEEIYKGNMTIIMGLVWTMIQKYQIKTSGVTVTTRRVGTGLAVK